MRNPPSARVARHVLLHVTGIILLWLFNGVLPVRAQDFTWLPSSGVSDPSNWFDAANWGGPEQNTTPPFRTPGPANSVSVNTTTTELGSSAIATITGGAATVNQLLIGATLDSGVIPSSFGEVIVNGTGASLTLSGTNLPPGQASLELVNGSLFVQNGATLTTSGSDIGVIGNLEPFVTVTGSGSTWIENGTLNIGDGNVNVTDGATLRAAGTVTIGTQGELMIGVGALGGTIDAPLIVNNGDIVFNLSDSTTLAAPITGSGFVVKTGSGTVILVGNNTYTGGTFIGGGTLQLGNGGTTGSIIGNVADSGILAFDRSDSYTFSGVISGTGIVRQNGTGTLVLTAINTYSGNTNVNAGTLLVNGSVGGGSVNVAFGATLGGTGTIGGPVTIQNGGVLSPGTLLPGTLTMGTLTLNSGSVLNFQLGTPNVIGNGANDLVNVNGKLTLAGTLNVTNVGGFGPGVYRLFNYTGTLTNHGLNFGTTPVPASDLLLQTSQAHQINLIVSSGGFANQFWDGATTTADGIIHGGSGTWDNVTTNWTDMDATANAPWNKGFAIFEGTAGTVTLGDNINFSGMQFITDGYIIAAPGNQTLIAGADTIIRVGQGVTATISTPIVDGSGAADVTKTDLGTLILTGTNTYSGGTTISTGTLQLGNGGTSGSIVGNVTDNGVFAIDRSDIYTFAGMISGSGSFEQRGTGTTIFTGINTYTGATTVNAGTLVVDGSIASAETMVNPFGVLAGTGLIQGNVVNNGIVSPGSPTGTLTISGNYVQNSSGTLRIAVGGTSPGQFSVLAVSGHATLGGTLRIAPINGFQLAVGDKLTFVTATGGVSGNFSTIQSLFGTAVAAQFSVLPDAVEVEGTQTSFVSILQSLGPVVTPNELAVAKALDSAVGDPREASLFAFLNSQPLSALPHDLTLIAPTQVSSMNATTVSHGRVQASNVGQRLNYIHAGGPSGFSSSGFGITGGAASFDEGFAGVSGPEGKAVPPVFAPTPENRWGVFVTGTGEFTNVDSTPNAAGYNVDTGGITVGVDYRLTPNLVIGLDGGYAHTNVSLDGGGHIDINAGTIGLYATVFGNGFYLNTAVSGGPSGYNTERTGLQGNASGSTNGGNIDFLISGGYDWTRGNLSIGPTATFQFSYVGLNGFTETGSLAPLKFRDQNYESERTIFGAKASYNWKIGNITLIPQISAGWVHEYGSVAYAVVANFATGAGNSFTVNGPEIGRDGVLVTAGMSMVWTNRISTYIYYDGELARTNYDSHTVTGGIRISF